MGPKGVTADSRAVQPEAATDSAAQPASQPAAETASAAQLASQPAAAAGGTAPSATLPLRELTKRSGQFGAWFVVVQQAKVDIYEYQYQGQQRNGKAFSCIFVSSDDPTEYCIGQLRWNKNNESKFLAVQKKLCDGFAFIMTKVSISNDAKKQYIHAPIQTVVNVADTTFSPVLHSKDSNLCYPEPPATIADCVHLTSQQFFDVTALVKTVSTPRPVKDNRVVFDIEIIDGSKSGECVRTMPLTVFTQRAPLHPLGEPPLWVFLNAACNDVFAQAVSFFQIKGAQDENGKFSFTTTKNSSIVPAAKTGKGLRLAAEAATLLCLRDTSSFAIRKVEEWVSRDFSQEHATETMCALFAPLATTKLSGDDALDAAEETLWQMNWVRVEEPAAGSNIRTNDGKRIWFPVTVRDCTGTLTLYIQENAALKLSGIKDADQFEDAFKAGKVWFPQMASVKIVRRVKPASAAQPASQLTQNTDKHSSGQVDVLIVDAACQNLAESPTEASARLLPLLNADNPTSDVVLPAALHMLRKSAHYTLAVESIVPDIPESLKASFVDVPSATTIFRPCSQVLALVESSEASKLQEAGGGGYKIITDNVKDLLHDSPDAPPVQLSSFCLLDNLQDFKLDPPRTSANKKQAALVLISSVLQMSSAGQPVSFMVDSVQLLQPAEVDAVKNCLKRLLFLTSLAGHMASRKRSASMPATFEESPSKAAKCRSLGRHPTAAPVPQYSCSADDGH